MYFSLAEEKVTDDDTSVHLASVKVTRSAPLIVAGRYVKLCRELPQTPWILDGERKLDLSVEELIAASVVDAFGADTAFNFVSSGREDVDVRYALLYLLTFTRGGLSRHHQLS